VAKKVSDNEKKRILNLFLEGYELKKISSQFNFTIQTITRQLKNQIGEDEFRRIKRQKRKTEGLIFEDNAFFEKENQKLNNSFSMKKKVALKEEFFEIPPLEGEVNLEKQIEISSEPISKFEFPSPLYMIIDKKIELQIKYLKDYPEWQFLPTEDLCRQTIKIYVDLKLAKKECMKDQKVIKVPNTNVFKIVAPQLISKGISRIICDDKLIAL
tara:strand:- start:268 stop:906 length:639 start_codon:yes stop_codon:yes gene_type:complete